MSRILRNISNSKANKRVLTSNIPARKEGLDGEERVAKITNKGVRLYRKELGQWWYTQFQQSEEADKITIGVATALTLGTVKIGNGLSITSSGTLSTDGSSANYYLDGITKSSNTLTFSVNGATNQDYTFGSNAFNSTTIPTNTNQLTNGAGFLTAVATANIADEAVTLAKLAHVATDVFLGRTSNGTGDVESMSVSDVNLLLGLDNYLTSISTINADKITAGTLPDARIQASGVTQHVGSIVHDSLSGFVANEHLDWTVNVGTIHAGNYTDTNTNQLTKFYFVDDDGDAIHPSHDNYIKFMNGNGITTNWNSVEAGGGINDPYILTITSTTVGTVTTVGVSTPITGGISQNGATGTIGHSNDAGNTHVPTTASKDGKFLKATSNNGKSEAWTDITENDITDLGTYLTTSQAQSAYLPKSSPTLTADTTLSMNNAKINARTSAGGGSDGLGTAGQVLHSHANGGGVYWATVADDMQWILEDHSGDQVTVADGKYVKFVAGTGLNINWNGGTGAVDNEYDLDFTISGYNNSNWDTAYGWGNHASGGYLTGITGQAIGSLSNVSSSSPSNGQILKWSTDTWVVSDNTVTIGSINDITDVSISGTTDNYILMYENATGRWKNEPTTDITSVGTLTSLASSGNVNITGTSGNQLRLSYNSDYYWIMERASNGYLNLTNHQNTTDAVAMTIDTSGKIGIGATSPGAILETTGSVDDNWAGRFENTHSGGYGLMALITGSSANEYALQVRSGSTHLFKVMGDGSATFSGDVTLAEGKDLLPATNNSGTLGNDGHMWDALWTNEINSTSDGIIYMLNSGGSLDIQGNTTINGVLYTPSSAYFIGNSSYGHRFNSHDDAYNNFIIYNNGDTYTRGNFRGNASHTSEVGNLASGAIKRIRMTQGGEIHFGDTTTSNFLGLTEGTVDQFTDTDRLGLYYRNELKMYSNTNTLRFIMDVNGNSTFCGGSNENTYNGITISGANPSLNLDADGSGGWSFVEYGNGGTTKYSVGLRGTDNKFYFGTTGLQTNTMLTLDGSNQSVTLGGTLMLGGYSTSGGNTADQAIVDYIDNGATSSYFSMGWKQSARSSEIMHRKSGYSSSGYYIEAGNTGEAGGICLDEDSVNVYGSSDNGTTFRVIDKDSNVVTFEMLQSSWNGVFRGDVIAYGSMSSISDKRIKINIEPYTNVLNKLSNIGVYSYNKITSPKNKKEIGVIAQEIQKEFPELIDTAKVDKPEDCNGLEEILTVDYEHLTAILLQGLKELRNEVNEIKGIA